MAKITFFTTVIMMMMMMMSVVMSQDPAQGWLAYATAQCPSGTRLTSMEAQWKVGANPRPSSAFFSPWFGSDTSDNLNLIQPVNPWFGSSWSAYTEYFQWSPENNVNSKQFGVQAGDLMRGQIVYNGDQSYTITQTDTTTGGTSSQVVKVQKKSNGEHKNYTILYIVYEKVANCGDYPPDEEVTFTNIVVQCNNQTIQPQWRASYVDEVCDFTANIVSPSQVQITWNTQSQKNPTEEQIRRNHNGRLQPRV